MGGGGWVLPPLLNSIEFTKSYKLFPTSSLKRLESFTELTKIYQDLKQSFRVLWSFQDFHRKYTSIL